MQEQLTSLLLQYGEIRQRMGAQIEWHTLCRSDSDIRKCEKHRSNYLVDLEKSSEIVGQFAKQAAILTG